MNLHELRAGIRFLLHSRFYAEKLHQALTRQSCRAAALMLPSFACMNATFLTSNHTANTSHLPLKDYSCTQQSVHLNDPEASHRPHVQRPHHIQHRWQTLSAMYCVTIMLLWPLIHLIILCSLNICFTLQRVFHVTKEQKNTQKPHEKFSFVWVMVCDEGWLHVFCGWRWLSKAAGFCFFCTAWKNGKNKKGILSGLEYAHVETKIATPNPKITPTDWHEHAIKMKTLKKKNTLEFSVEILKIVECWVVNFWQQMSGKYSLITAKWNTVLADLKHMLDDFLFDSI